MRFSRLHSAPGLLSISFFYFLFVILSTTCLTLVPSPGLQFFLKNFAWQLHCLCYFLCLNRCATEGEEK